MITVIGWCGFAKRSTDGICRALTRHIVTWALNARHWWALCLLAFSGLLWAQPTPGAPQVAEPLRVYVRSDCPHCADAKAFLHNFQKQHPGLDVVYRPVDTDPLARDELINLSRKSGYWPPSVPTFAYRDQVLVGFAGAAQTGSALDAMLAAGQAPEPLFRLPVDVFPDLSVERWGLPLFTLAIGLMDGFNPCAMWVLLFLLSLLVHLRDRRRIALIAGTFVAVSGAIYFGFMAAWLNVFLAVGLSQAVRVGLAVLACLMALLHLKDFVWGFSGVSLSIPTGAKAGLYSRMRQVMQARSLMLALLGVTGLAVAVNTVELLCTAGLPAMYTALLTQQGLEPWAHYAYLGLYISAYVADDSLMVATAVWALNSRKLTETRGRWLKLVSALVMLSLALLLLLRPEWLH